ncbi:hypothetical protein BSZ19_06220 [Bradyrhizobium japonicum]|uniref:Methyl-accepting chemotaxis protein n=2 Tax=Bradyrhizobium japonicum TaxID=375 RepID=A0A1Y2JWU7_BRAJP|nr:hypothetical protein BSZ19_06220 [Bradyrhizobium japonicum]
MALLGISGVLVTGAICAAALNYASLVQSASNDSNQFKADVVSLSQSFLESRQIASDFLRKPSEVSIKKYADNYEQQLADLSRVEAFVTASPEDDPLKQATSLRPVIGLYATRFHNLSQHNATSASTKRTDFRASCARPCTPSSNGWQS